MNKFKYILLVLLFGSTSYTAKAQSSNFNQYHLTPVYTSPAEIGTTDYFQVLGHFRKQSLSQDQGYQNFALSSVYPLYYKDGGRRFGGIGVGLMSETSGMMGMLKENSINAGYAYNWQVSRSHFVSFGLQGAYHRRNMDLGSVRTDSQYQNGTYVPGGSNGENFTDDVSQAFMANTGATWYVIDEQGDQKFSLGVAAFNVNRSSYEFLASSQEQAAPVRYQAYGSIRALSKDRIQLVPTFRYMFEKNYSQLNMGSLFLYQLQEGKAAMHESHLGLGAWYSLNNAAIFSVQLVQPSYVVSLSYDLPASSKIDQMQVNNGVELTFGWRLNKGKGRKGNPKYAPEVAEEKEAVQEEVPAAQKQEELAKQEQLNQKATKQEEKVAEPAKEIQSAGMEEKQPTQNKLSPEERKILENSLVFPVGSSELSPSAKAGVKRVVEIMNRHPDLELQIIGHTCTLGSEAVNKSLSLKRAEIAKKAFIAEGIAPERIKTEGRYYLEPVAPNNTEEGRIKNRRVEFQVVE